MEANSSHTKNIDIKPPVRAARTSVYNAIYDAENRLVTFIGMNEKMDTNALFIADAINAALEYTGEACVRGCFIENLEHDLPQGKSGA